MRMSSQQYGTWITIVSLGRSTIAWDGIFVSSSHPTGGLFNGELLVQSGICGAATRCLNAENRTECDLLGAVRWYIFRPVQWAIGGYPSCDLFRGADGEMEASE